MQPTNVQIWLLLPTLVIALLALVIMMSIVVIRQQSGSRANTNSRSNASSVLISRLSLGGYGLFTLLVLAGYWLPATTITPLIFNDQLARLMMLLIGLCGLCISWQSDRFFAECAAGGNQHRNHEYYLLLSLAMLGTLVLVQANHVASWILGLELLGLTSVILAVYPYSGQKSELPHQLEAGIKYLILSGVASAILFFGLGLYFLSTGQLLFSPLAAAPESQVLFIALLMIFAGMAFKLSLFPFHQWTPDLYQGAALPTSTLLATVSKLAAVVVLVRFVHQSNLAQWLDLRPILAPLAILSMIGGNLLALQQQDLRRLLAYSAIAHMGYLILALQMAGDTALHLSTDAAIFYLVAYVLTSLGAFLWLTGYHFKDHASGEAPLESLRGLFWQQPAYALLLLLLLLSLAGIPMTIGFFGKFYLINVALSYHLWPELLALLVGSGLGLYYYLRVVLMVCSSPATAPQEQTVTESQDDNFTNATANTTSNGQAVTEQKMPLFSEQLLSKELLRYWPAWILGALVLLLGIFPQLLSQHLTL